MTKAKTATRLDEAVAAPSPTVDVRPKLFLLLGRGSRGKTLLARWMIDRAANAGRPVIPADGDRTNQTLVRFFPGAVSPPSADDADVRGWVAGLVEGLLTGGHDTLLDLGGGDLILKGVARDMDLLPWLMGLGVEVVVVHLLGPSIDDATYLQSVEEGGLLASPATILVLNEGVVPVGRSAHAAFSETIQTQPVFGATVARGARLVAMPRLEPAPDLEGTGLTFLSAAQGHAPAEGRPLGPWKAQQVAIWLRRMEANFASVLEWLP
ncbi:hypothetical protein [Methylobacterium sp. E-066]|uniref:hypothetical protein n=1 Tax=Methylobacterium sp. E-066 TaxID=2836584 RepID=UPI001FBA1754|nr:hypothetical protein [Methylobacterium sp. E-066]MCJ2139427.1 hypothetical protein [Methylobacterium sp. E-066]